MLICMLLISVATYGQQQVFSLLSPTGKGKTGIVALDDVTLSLHSNDVLGLQMQVTLMGDLLPRRERVLITPRLVAEGDSIDFPSVELYGRWSYYRKVRSGVDDYTSDMHFRDRDARQPRHYSKQVPYQSWMRTAQLKLIVTRTDGCDRCLSAQARRVQPSGWPLAFVQQRQVKAVTVTDTTRVVTAGETRHFQGAAFIDFAVNRTDLNADYRNNRTQLAKIQATLDSVLSKDRSLLQHITLKGYASPEGAYNTNALLASGRVNSLRRYFIDHFNVPAHLISAEYEAEDWEGLRRYIDASDMTERQALLAIIDTDLDPDTKLARISARYPAAYKFLLTNVFPTLRHTDYRIDFSVREADKVLAHVSEKSIDVEETPSDAPWLLADSTVITPAPATTDSHISTYRPWLALKTNLLADAILAPNIEVEMPLGRANRWSLLGEFYCPWWRTDYNAAGVDNPYYRADQRPTKTAYQVLAVGAELRYWMAPRCRYSRPTLTGAFIGLYGAGGKYDIGRDGEGNQGEFTTLGLSIGYSWPLSRHWNLELSIGGGFVGGPKVHYKNEFDDTHLIYRSHQDNWFYIGPTKAKVSVAWVIGK